MHLQKRDCGRIAVSLILLFVGTDIIPKVPVRLGPADLIIYDKIELSQDDKDFIIKQALDLELPITDTMAFDEVVRFTEQSFKKVQAGDYEGAINILLSGLKQYPNSFTLQFYLATNLGDCAEITSDPLKERMIQKSKCLFDRLMMESDGQPKQVLYFFKNEYYFRFACHREQYELGCQWVSDYWDIAEWNSIGFKGYYTQGVGAAQHARQLVEQSNRSLALEYAQKALVAWAQYFSYKNDYYNSYVHYALALGILGCKEEMMKALHRSASLINRDLSYGEFKEVIEFIREVNAERVKNNTYSKTQ